MIKAPEYNYIYLQPINKEWRPGIKILEKEMGEDYKKFYGDFLQWMAKRYKEEIVQAIDNQRFKKNEAWPPLNLAYYKRKEKKGLSLKMWEATGFLKENIEVFNKRNRVVVGFRFFVLYEDKNVSPLLVSRVLEFGNDKCPPRPLWRPLYRYMRKHVRRYWEKYIMEV